MFQKKLKNRTGLMETIWVNIEDKYVLIKK